MFIVRFLFEIDLSNREKIALRRSNLAAVCCIVALTILGLLASMSFLEAHATTTTIVGDENLCIYSDRACTQVFTSIHWGIVSPGDSVSQTIYIKNTGSYRQRLSLLVKNWNPAAANSGIELSWDAENARVDVGQVVAATLTLKVSSDASGFSGFTVDVVIIGESHGRV